MNATLRMRKFETEEAEKEGRFWENKLNYSRYTCKYTFICNDYDLKKQENNEEKGCVFSKELQSVQFRNNINGKHRKRGRKRIYNILSKNRKQELKAEKERIYQQAGCVYDVLKNVLKIFPKRMLNTLITKKAKTWTGLKKIIQNFLKENIPKTKLIIEQVIKNAANSLEKNLKLYKKILFGQHIIIYKTSKSHTGHCGIIENGKISMIKKNIRITEKKVSENFIKLEKQENFIEDLKKNIDEPIIFRIEKEKEEKKLRKRKRGKRENAGNNEI